MEDTRSIRPIDPGTLGATVAAHCDVCGKSPSFGNSISHSHRRTSRRWNPNIQTVRTVVNGTPKKVNACTSCLKAGKVTR
jgi:large subunit ribosomal protein L28